MPSLTHSVCPFPNDVYHEPESCVNNKVCTLCTQESTNNAQCCTLAIKYFECNIKAIKYRFEIVKYPNETRYPLRKVKYSILKSCDREGEKKFQVSHLFTFHFYCENINQPLVSVGSGKQFTSSIFTLLFRHTMKVQHGKFDGAERAAALIISDFIIFHFRIKLFSVSDKTFLFSLDPSLFISIHF